MKKFSTARFILAIVYGFLPLSGLAAPLSPEASAPMTQCEFLTNAPDQHVVVRGDTLWGISTLFLRYPWCWPQVWDINRDQIHDPHWIYPSQIVYLDRVAGRLRLGTPFGQGGIQGGTRGQGKPTCR